MYDADILFIILLKKKQIHNFISFCIEIIIRKLLNSKVEQKLNCFSFEIINYLFDGRGFTRQLK